MNIIGLTVICMMSAVMSVLALLFLLSTRKAIKGILAFKHAITEENIILKKHVSLMLEKIAGMQDNLSILKKQMQKEKSNPNRSNFQQAGKMVTLGASLEDVMESCGLNRAEAILLFDLKGRASSNGSSIS